MDTDKGVFAQDVFRLPWTPKDLFGRLKYKHTAHINTQMNVRMRMLMFGECLSGITHTFPTIEQTTHGPAPQGKHKTWRVTLCVRVEVGCAF